MNRRYHYPLIVLLLGVLLLSTAVCIKPPEPAVPVIVSFTASPTEMNPGQWITLEWNTSGTTSVMIQPEIKSVGPSGSLKLSPDQTTIYELTATNEAGSAKSSVTVTVIPAIITGEPDLVITDVFGCDGIICYKIKNQGNAAAGPTKTHLYSKGATGNYNFNKIPRLVDYVDSLAPGAEIMTTFPNQDPRYPVPGRSFEICVDADNDVAESNEDNNCWESYKRSSPIPRWVE